MLALECLCVVLYCQLGVHPGVQNRELSRTPELPLTKNLCPCGAGHSETSVICFVSVDMAYRDEDSILDQAY